MTGSRLSCAASSVWRSEEFDLDRFLRRIGHTGNTEPTFTTLRALQAAYAMSVPWDGVDMFLGRPAVLEAPKILDKITTGRRGLTCEEHTTVFAAALSALGFHVECRSARVRMGAKNITGLSHAVVVAVAEEKPYLCDVGFGMGTLEPVLLADGARSELGSWRHKVRRENGEWVLAGKLPQGWVDFSGFADAPRYPVDNLFSNHFLSTHARSVFRKNLRVCKATLAQMTVLHNDELKVESADEILSTRAVAPEEAPAVLAEEFGVVLGSEDRQLLVATIRERLEDSERENSGS
jgi:N-hydroxyarylamine O-acetyltransferase